MDPVVFYKSLADDTRLRTLMLIGQEGELCVCELTEALGLSQPKISRHLKLLREAGLLSDRRQGQWVFYRINEALPDWAKAQLQAQLQATPDFIHANAQQLATMGCRPGRCC
ncbi:MULTISPECIES: metalloregulator ArsR/SmtB family transcription factor [Shewanella]|uniref:Metalloregulator ArsR/SmtB family transcription factor n=2 Tax=Shewanella TaxID=22 RepID=A0A974XSF6_9GAMM|nr:MULTISPECIES: metalloregulator ArsR/SmtB family transcription factor [Shewanella]QSX29634.1 metalloregulator ArsR/SmtB family transcription factor [Shewanella cyperi]QSX36809.1 metalloregulator ArsR/SmtB family transcription factor [Shewanella sedimentimangrovi]QSX40415.1 metalloregulator ArsR/SmtB family transcription factor [Shewanella cyperi]